MTHQAYTRAVALFEALVEAPEIAVHASPAKLIQAAGVPPSSGYRHVGALEAEGLLRRDGGGTYLPGLSAIRTGLNGFGLGHLAPLVQPMLLQLRFATQHTSFLAIVQDMDVWMGPFTTGRETRGTRVERQYSFDTIPDLAPGTVVETTLRSFDGRVPRRTKTLLVPVETTSRVIAVIGLVLDPGRGVQHHLTRALETACAQCMGKVEEV